METHPVAVSDPEPEDLVSDDREDADEEPEPDSRMTPDQPSES
jgi:hypothetical protein